MRLHGEDRFDSNSPRASRTPEDSREELADFAFAGKDERAALVRAGFARLVPRQFDIVQRRKELYARP